MKKKFHPKKKKKYSKTYQTWDAWWWGAQPILELKVQERCFDSRCTGVYHLIFWQTMILKALIIAKRDTNRERKM
jgi:hypothetical protein